MPKVAQLRPILEPHALHTGGPRIDDAEAGADVTGIDLREELSGETVTALRRALLKHKMLFFRDQPIEP
jgi:alpha-ketoglutarate-dependent taurine dioxygenase